MSGAAEKRTVKGEQKEDEMKIPTKFLLFTALALFMLSGCYAPPEKRAEMMVEKISTKLDLDSGQRMRLEEIKASFVDRRKGMADAREVFFDDMIALMNDDELTEAELNEVIGKHQKRADEFIAFLFGKVGEFHSVLTPEQRAAAASELAEHKEKDRGRHGRGFKGGGY